MIIIQNNTSKVEYAYLVVVVDGWMIIIMNARMQAWYPTESIGTGAKP